MSLSQLQYRGTSLLSGQPLPILSKSVEYLRAGERYAEVESWKLDGFLTGCSSGDLIYQRNLLSSGFSNCFGPLSIAGLSFEQVEIKNIDFPDSELIGHLNFSIDFQCYTGFSGITGVLDPNDELDYREERDGTLTLIRTISANGVNVGAVTGTNAALNFINARLSIDPIAPFVITGARNITFDDFYLVSSEQRVDKLNGEVSASQTYLCDPSGVAGTKSIVNRYTTEITEDYLESTIAVNINGRISAGRFFTGTQSGFLDYYKDFKNLYPKNFFTSESVEDDRYTNSLSYSFSFPSGSGSGFYQNLPDVNDDFTITFKDSPSTSLIDISVQGSVSVPYGCREDRLIKASGAASTGSHLDLVNDLYDSFYSGCAIAKPQFVSVNPNPLSQDVSVDRFSSTASYSFSFNDRYVPSGIDQDSVFDYKIGVTLPTDIYFIKENFSGGIFIKQKANVVSREVISTEASLDGASGNLSGYISGVFESFGTGTDESYTQNARYNSSDENLQYSYSEIRSYNNDENVFTVN